MPRNSHISDSDAQVIALKALAFLVSDSDRIDRFVSVTGIAPESIRARAAEVGFLGAVLEHFRSDQPLLLTFAESAGIDPETIDAAGIRLGGFNA